MDDLAAYAFRGRVVRFAPIGRLHDYRLFLGYSAGVIGTADQERVTIDQLVARLRPGANRWGLTVPLTGMEEHELAFVVAMPG